MNSNKKILIAVGVLAAVSLVLYLMRDKLAAMFGKGDEMPPQNATAPQPAPDPAPATIATPPPAPGLKRKDIALGDTVYADGPQQIQRISLRSGKYESTDDKGNPIGKGAISDGSSIGSVIKITPAGFYVRARAGLPFDYYWVGTSQVYKK